MSTPAPLPERRRRRVPAGAIAVVLAAAVALSLADTLGRPTTSTAAPTTGTAGTDRLMNQAPQTTGPQEGGRVKVCGEDGSWFPAQHGALQTMVDGFLAADPPDIPASPIALIAPHAGYAYSGAVAGAAYASLRGHDYDRVIVMGLSHGTPLRGVSVLEVDAWQTPLGRIEADAAARDELLRCPVVHAQPRAHDDEHSVVNQLPFLQRAIPGGFRMVEMLVGELADRDRTRLARVLRELLTERTLLVVSSDFTHYGAQFGYTPFTGQIARNLEALNNMAVQEILQVDVPGFDAFLDQTQDTICGRNAIGLLLEVLSPFDDARGLRVAFDTSGRMTGNWTTSVSYAAIVFWREQEGLEEAEQQVLLEIARRAAGHFLATGDLLTVNEADYELTPRLRAPGAAFVTLTNRGELRGCIGHVVAMMPLYRSVAQNAVQACRDPRFTYNPIRARELEELHIEISVLTPMRRLLDPDSVEVGRDGLMMIRGNMSGLLLPQVPVEQGWDREEFLAHTCLKAGLPQDSWRDPETEILRFSAQVFGEREHRD